MTRLRLCLASLLVASSLSTACSTATASTKVAAPSQLEPTRTFDRAAVRAKLAERRAISVKNFLAYRDAMVYPVVDGQLGQFRHMWVDASGNLCAAATLISKDWGREAAVRAGNPNGIKLSDVKKGPLADWILTSGLTHHEIVAIQVPGFNEQRSRQNEINRLHAIYVDVERQLAALGDESLDAATDALMKRPDLARIVLDGRVAGAGAFAKPHVG